MKKKDSDYVLVKAYPNRSDYSDSVSRNGFYLLSKETELQEFLELKNIHIETKKFFQELKEIIYELIRDNKMDWDDLLKDS